MTDKHYVTAGCTISAKDGRLYLGGYNQPNERTNNRHIWCLDAKDGSLIWQSDAVASAVNVVSVGDKFLFSNAIRGDGRIFYISQQAAWRWGCCTAKRRRGSGRCGRSRGELAVSGAPAPRSHPA